MKLLVLSIVTLMSLQAFSCLPEAQFIAKVESSQAIGGKVCLVKVDMSAIQMYNPSMICPLDRESLSDGIETSPKSDGTCFYKAGDGISGVVVMKSNGNLMLD